MRPHAPGLIALLGSGETAASSGIVYEKLIQHATPPVQIGLLETPAGFQPNAAQVAGKVAEFLRVRLQNYQPAIHSIAARKRQSAFSPEDPEVSEALCSADLIYLGAGSPTYTVQQLANSLTWQRTIARQRHGASILTASAATLAISRYTLPVYEIYKVGMDLHWQDGLDLFGAYGISLTFVPHWDNNEGGSELDTSHCFIGRERFEQLFAMLPTATTVVGIDEHTGIVFDLAADSAQILGKGGVTIRRTHETIRFERNQTFALQILGDVVLPEPTTGLPQHVWEETRPRTPSPVAQLQPPAEVFVLLEARQQARSLREWARSDQLRAQIATHGWLVRDTPQGQVVEPA
jgi:cyanophycinase-like exopeptidase